MANQEHLDIINQGPSVAREWRQANNKTGFDLSGADFSGRDLRNYDFSHSNLSGANFSRCDLRGCNLNASNINSTKFDRANLSQSRLQSIVDAEKADFTNCRLIETNINSCQFSDCSFTKAFLLDSSIFNTNFFEVNFDKCSFHRVSISNVDLKRSSGIRTTVGLDTLYFETNQVTSFETTIQEWPEKYLDWEKLRTVGKLPLFGASYFALIVIPIYFHGLDIYNQNIELLRDWAIQSTQREAITSKYFAEFVIDKVHTLPVPTRSLAILISTFFLAVGSTLYTFYCPSRVKEYSKDQWVDELNKSLVNYWLLSWKNRAIRLLTSSFYAIGGTCLIFILLEKLYGVFMYVVKYS